MPLRGWDEPFSEIEKLRRAMNRLVETYGPEISKGVRAVAPSFAVAYPPANVSRTDSAVIVRAELPGVDPGTLDISIMGDSLTIKGERRPNPDHAQANVHRQEREFGAFDRTIALPERIDPGKTPDATYRDGVLTIACPRAEE